MCHLMSFTSWIVEWWRCNWPFVCFLIQIYTFKCVPQLSLFYSNSFRWRKCSFQPNFHVSNSQQSQSEKQVWLFVSPSMKQIIIRLTVSGTQTACSRCKSLVGGYKRTETKGVTEEEEARTVLTQMGKAGRRCSDSGLRSEVRLKRSQAAASLLTNSRQNAKEPRHRQ